MQRPSPAKHWLSETQIAQLKAERVSSQIDEAWYRIADLLFENEQDYNADNFRAEHTPCKWACRVTATITNYVGALDYDRVRHRNPFPEEPSPYRSPDSMWTPVSDSTNPSGSTPMVGNQPDVAPIEPAEEREPSRAAVPLPYQQPQDFCNQPGPEVAGTVTQEAPDPTVNHPKPCRYDNPEVGVSDSGVPSNDGYPALETPNFFLSELAALFHGESTAADDQSQLEPRAEDLPPAAPAPTPCNPETLDQFSNAGITLEQPPSACSTCGRTPKCSCRLKKRVADLRSENGSLWAEKEKMRGVLDGLRQMLEDRDELLQAMEEKGMVLAEAMGQLWDCQDRMRAVVMGPR